jgi:hypothetical protein
MRQRWEAKKRGEVIPPDSASKVVLAGREESVTVSPTLTDDDVPF